MTEAIVKTRNNKRKTKKRKAILVTILLIFVLVLGALSYIFWEYRQGLKSADKPSQTVANAEDFNGSEKIDGIVNVLLLGLEKSHSDTIIIAQYNSDAKKAKLVSIMRDTYVAIPGHDMHKINDAFKYGGPEMVRKTLKENFDIDVQYYAIVNYEGFTKVIDSGFPDGIEVNVEKMMSKGIGMTIEPGFQRLDGTKLLGYVRFRKDTQNDFGRVNRQQEVLKKIAEEAVSVHGILKLPRMIGTMQPYIETNMNTALLLSIGTSFFSNDERDIETLRVPLDGTYTDGRHGGQLTLDIDLEKNTQAIHTFLR